MLIPVDTLRRIASGTVELAFRRWHTPPVGAGETLLTAVGVLAIEAVDEVDPQAITEAEARAAGYDSLTALRGALAAGTADATWRIRLRWAGPDPRLELRARLPDAEALGEIRARLELWDRHSPVGPWTRATLEIVRTRPRTGAAELAEALGMRRDRFKDNVRKLKGLGLTESLQVGYRLSARGAAVLEVLAREPDTP